MYMFINKKSHVVWPTCIFAEKKYDTEVMMLKNQFCDHRNTFNLKIY